MGFRPSFTSLPRLLFGAALVILGFFLASSTQARADDLGPIKTLLTVVDSTTGATPPTHSPSTPVAKIVEEPAAVVADVVKAVEPKIATPREAGKPAVQPVTKSVTHSVTKVVTTTASVTSQATALVTKATAEVTNTTATIVRTVEPLLPASETVVEPIVEVVEGVVPVVDSAAAAVVPIPTADATDLVGSDIAADSPEVVLNSAPTSEQTRTPRAGAAAASAVVPALDAGAITTFAPFSESTPSQDHPRVPAPAPAVPVGGALPGTGSTGGSGHSGHAGADGATPPAVLVVPETRSASVLSKAARPHAGPTLDPGSRPD